MNPVTAGHLAEYLGVNKSTVSLAIKGRNGNEPLLDVIQVNGKNMIDTDDPKNKLYIKECCERKGIRIPNFKSSVDRERVAKKPKSVIIKPSEKPEPIKEDKEENTEFESSYEEVDPKAEKLKWDIEKVKAQAIKENLQIEKLSGTLIPVDETSHVLNYVISNYTSAAKSHIVSFLNLIVKELGGTDDDFKHYLDQFDEGMVEFAENAIEEISSGIDGVIDSYKEVRGRGERK